MSASKWGNASQQLQSSWTTQQDARIAALETKLEYSESERKRLAYELAVCSGRCEEFEGAALQSSAMLWNMTRRLVLSNDIFGRPIVRLPAVAEAVASLPPGSQLRTEAKLQIGRIVARLPEFKHQLEKTKIKLEDGSVRAINMFEDTDLPKLLPVLFEWIEKQPFTVWEDAFDLVQHELSPYLIPDLSNIILAYLGAPAHVVPGTSQRYKRQIKGELGRARAFVCVVSLFVFLPPRSLCSPLSYPVTPALCALLPPSVFRYSYGSARAGRRGKIDFAAETGSDTQTQTRATARRDGSSGRRSCHQCFSQFVRTFASSPSLQQEGAEQTSGVHGQAQRVRGQRQ